MKYSSEDLADFIELQLSVWPAAKRNYDRLMDCRRKPLALGDFTGFWQFSPERIRSTAASVDADSVKARGCFLCPSARPTEQMSFPISPGWEMLVNPYPILPVHFTIVSGKHEPQSAPPFEMVSIAESLPGMAVFFNGSKAGASAPDHMHFQAVLKSELPLVRLLEQRHSVKERGIRTGSQLGLELPFEIISAVVYPDNAGMRETAAMLDGRDGKVNIFSWMDDSGLLRLLHIPRQAHRPSCYFKKGEEEFMVSPGAIDMAGILILPRLVDFERADVKRAMEVYTETGVPQQ